jgi:hypothetical protein
LLMNRRIIAPTMGKKISIDKMGIPRMVMKPAPLIPPSPLYEKGVGGDSSLIKDGAHDIIT